VTLTASVRKAATPDIDQIMAIDPNVRSDERRVVEIADAVSKHNCFVATDDDGSITGYTVFRTDFFGFGFVWLLVVAADRHRSGIGETLMAAVEHANPTAKLFTSTNRSNMPMRRLLSKRGFAEVGTLEGLDEGDPEVFYLKRRDA
jgi:ribosomal protein S18 acetylase RimI-like enzyme